MSEPVTLALVAEVLGDLQVHFPGKRANQDLRRLAEIYRDGLVGISGDGLRHAGKRSIQEDTFFPKVARLRELAVNWETYNRATRHPDIVREDELHCPRCGETFHWQRKHRPYFGRTETNDTDYRGGWLASADGKWLLLEPFDRLGCRCSSRDAHVPHPDMDPPCEPIIAGQWLPVRTKRSGIDVHELSPSGAEHAAD